MRRKRNNTLTQNTYNGKVIGITNAPSRLAANGCWGFGEITNAIRNGTAALEETSLWPPNHLIVEYLVCAGGGNASQGAGGAGGKVEGADGLITLGVHACTVGAGAAPGGESSIGSLYVSEGGGQGNANDGGSGAGGYYNQGTFGEGIDGQGNDGGSVHAVNQLSGGGGGGAGAAGSPTVNSRDGGNGGAGEASSISGSSVTYCGGGGGASYNQEPGEGAAGGGGNGAEQGANPTNGTANLGGGGGGAWDSTKGNGGSGIVIVRYKGDRVLDGGTDGTSGDYKIHTFTSTSNLGLGFAGS